MGAQQQYTVRIFLASPSADTLHARARVAEVVQEIGADPQYAVQVRLELRRWDDPARPVICDRSGNPQQDIVRQVGAPGECELVIGLFAHTMGGTLPADRFPPPPERDEPWFCSEWEVEQGLLAGTAVWVFHDQRPLTDTSAKAKRKSLAVSEYIERHNPPDGPMSEGYNPFKDEDDLAGKLRHGLRVWLSREFIRQPNRPVAASDLTRRQREQAHLAALVERLAQHETRYVPLAGTETPEQRLERVLKDMVMPSDLVFEAFGFDQGYTRQSTPATVTYTDVLDAYRALPQRGAVRRLAVLGEPGAGKSFSLARIACELARKALADPGQPVPVLVALGLWTEPAESLDDFIARCSLPAAPKGLPQGIRPILLADDLQALRAERRLLLLLDAVNEIPPGQRRDKVAAIAALAHDEHLAGLVLSCRQRDFEAELQSRLPFDTLRLQPLRPWQVRDFLRRSLILVYGEAEGLLRAEDKFWQIAGGERMRQVWQTLEQAGETFEALWAAEDEVPQGLAGRSWAEFTLWRQARFDPRSLIRLAENPFLLFVMMQLPVIPLNRAQLFAGFLKVLYQRERATRTQRGDGASVPPLDVWRAVLVQMAEALQRVDGQAGDDGVRTALARADWPASLTDEMLAFSIDASVLQRVDDEVRFTHQLLQESLAADVLLQSSCTDSRSASAFWPNDHGWSRTGWEVVAEIAAEACVGDVPTQIRLIDWLARTAPKMALDIWNHAGRPALQSALLARTKTKWLPRMTDVQVEPEPEARMAIGCWLGALDLDDRTGTGLRPDGAPDIDWVLIDDGLPFIYQGEPHLPLPAYAISRYLVTNRQWQAFLDDGGYQDERWWQGLVCCPEPRQPQWTEPTAPRETVSWFEAVAYTRWLSKRFGHDVTLPTEQQWERAAAGVDGRNYPWCHDWDNTRANAGFRLGRTALVGLYPDGAATSGAQDMAGNVWEWCLNEYDKPQNTGSAGDAHRVLRGGAWNNPSINCSTSHRIGYATDGRTNHVGFRLVMSDPIQSTEP
ncbi:MAG: formylglycine-generating enzyme family protein [Leptothrix sp. (in: b-proteobacteria)]